MFYETCMITEVNLSCINNLKKKNFAKETPQHCITTSKSVPPTISQNLYLLILQGLYLFLVYHTEF